MPNTKSESPYIFSTDEQLRQDLKNAMKDRGFSFNAISNLETGDFFPDRPSI